MKKRVIQQHEVIESVPLFVGVVCSQSMEPDIYGIVWSREISSPTTDILAIIGTTTINDQSVLVASWKSTYWILSVFIEIVTNSDWNRTIVSCLPGINDVWFPDMDNTGSMLAISLGSSCINRCVAYSNGIAVDAAHEIRHAIASTNNNTCIEE